MIRLTDKDNGEQLRVNENQIIAYWWQDSAYTYIMLNKSFATVKETPDDIDKLLAEVQ